MQLLEKNSTKFNELVEQVLEVTKNPTDMYEVAAVLESIGWNDAMVNDEFGANDIFKIAEDIWSVTQNELLTLPINHAEKLDYVHYFFGILRSFIRGTIFALPMAVSVVAMLTLRFSLWSYEYLSLENATSISIGTILSFMVVGGFTQAIARRGFMYLGLGYYDIARKSTYYFVKLGYIMCVITAIIYLFINSIFSIYPMSMILITILYLLFLSGIWLSVTVLYILQKELIFTGLITAGIGIVFILFRLVCLNIILSQVIALSIVSLASIIMAHYIFIRAERKMEKGIAPTMPRRSITFYTSLPYFAYGFLYFTFLNIDRIIAWSTNNIYMPYFVWFRGEYELGLDFALIVLILPMGLVEVVVNELISNLLAHQKNTQAIDYEKLNQMYRSFFIKRYSLVSIFCVINALILFLVLVYVTNLHIVTFDFLSNPTILFTFIWAVISYSLLALSLMNSLILFCLAQPTMVSYSMLIALLVDMIVGFLLSRWIAYSWAVLGLFAGSVVFAILTTKKVFKVFENLDYYLYAAL
ncbi:hypothetical protein DEAC_c18270 [Desulfosporosinus acididurans]|uniref:Uncharacterized protein n=1 Tax=Desulfosporosinus acididurans TaxID=476652 RepID=A0A0J1FTW6_9FIRM|nr:hypothetical protein [Desulfosporosinus acididurans]KLU66428.1 hypothetical protein DEAC_c18270 [Desulfosporosinus acididurans]